MAFLYEFEWDPVKAQTNFDKHGLDFERAATVLLDPLALTIPDEEQALLLVGRVVLDMMCVALEKCGREKCIRSCRCKIETIDFRSIGLERGDLGGGVLFHLGPEVVPVEYIL